MAKRKQISKKDRFEVFKRDFFTCQYCSRKSPDVLLEIDHVIPVSKGGSNDFDNLVTACFDCNRGKSGTELNTLIPSLEDKILVMQEKQRQYAEFIKLQENLLVNYDRLINLVESVYSSCYPDYVFGDKFRLTVKNFIKKLGVDEVIDAMEIACSKRIYSEHKVLTYFCGVCWNKIKNPF